MKKNNNKITEDNLPPPPPPPPPQPQPQPKPPPIHNLMNIYPSQNAPPPSSKRAVRMRKTSIKVKAQDVAREEVRKRINTSKSKPEENAKRINAYFATDSPPPKPSHHDFSYDVCHIDNHMFFKAK